MDHRTRTEIGQEALGTEQPLRGTFTAIHDPPEAVSDVMLGGLFGLLGATLGALRRSTASKWRPLDGVPRGRVTIGVTDDDVIIGRRGTTYVRLPRAEAFGEAEGPLGDAWIEIGGVQFKVAGAEADEALRVWRSNRSTT